jgi:hypothetical protein
VLTFLRRTAAQQLTHRQTIGVFLAAGWLFCFVMMVGAEFYASRTPTLKEVGGYAFLSAVLSPMGAIAIALKGGWLQNRYGKQIALALVAVVLLGILAAWII